MTHTCTKVTVRQRAIRNDKISLYLDYYPAVRHPETMIKMCIRDSRIADGVLLVERLKQ